MNRPKTQFLTAPARSLFHFGRNAAIGQNLTGESFARAVFDWKATFDAASVESTHRFQDKVKENYEKKLQSLSGKIKAMEKQNIDPEVIKENLKKEKIKMLQEAFDQALKDLKINKDGGKPVTYLEVVNDPDYGSRIETIYKSYEFKVDADVSQAVDNYFTQKSQLAGKITAALTAIPAATAGIDFKSPNPEIQRYQEFRAARVQVLDKSKKNLSELLQNEALRYRATAGEIDQLTSPSGGKIDDYDDGWNPFNKVNDENSPTRMRLNGYLYANYIFAGGGEIGKNAVAEGIKKPYELYHSTFGDSKLTTKNLDEGMGLRDYFKEASDYSTFDRPIGLMAGLLQLTEQNIKDPTELSLYLEHIRGKFTELKTGPAANNEEKQMELLFSIKPRSELLSLDPNWKVAYDKIDQQTVDGKINDYPGTDATSPTRMQLNGYLYSVYLFNGKNNDAVQAQIDRAAKVYDDSRSFSHPTKMFTQEHLESNLDGGFELKTYLKRAGEYTQFDKIKGVIAGLLKQSESIGNSEDKEQYQKYLDVKFDAVKKADGEDNQLMLLATIRPQAESVQEVRERMRIGIINLMIKASQQHNQFKFSPSLSADFAPDKPTLDSKTYLAKAAQARTEIENFIKTSADAHMKDLRDKYKVLDENNSKLKRPLLSPADLEPLRLAVEDSDKKFNEARAVNRATEFPQAVEDKYLEKLTNAEKIYIDRVTELDARLQSVKEGGSATPTNIAPTGGDAIEAGPSSGSTGAEESPESPENSDKYTAVWDSAEKKDTEMMLKQGVFLTKAPVSGGKINIRNSKGEIIEAIPDKTPLLRTAKDITEKARHVLTADFIQITYKGNPAWIAENLVRPVNVVPTNVAESEKKTSLTPEAQKYREKGDKMQKELLDKLVSSIILADLVYLLKNQGYEKAKVDEGLSHGFDNMDLNFGTKFDRNNPGAQFALLSEMTLLAAPNISAETMAKFDQGELNRFDLSKMVFQSIMDKRIAASTGAEKTKWQNVDAQEKKIFASIEGGNLS